MGRCEMASFPLTVLLAFSLSIAFVSTLTDKQLDELDKIEKLLLRLQNEIDHMRNADSAGHITKMPSVRNVTDENAINGSSNDNKTKTSFETTANTTDEDYDFRNLTTPMDNKTTQSMKVDSNTTVSDTTNEVLDLATTISDWQNSIHSGPEITTVPSDVTLQENVQSTGSSRLWVTQTKGLHQTTAEEKKDKDEENKDKENSEDKDREDKDKEKNEDKDREEENELREVKNVRLLIEEGEDLERQLKGVFMQLRSLSQCAPVGKKCGVHEDQAKCCKGLKCSDTRSGICVADCVPPGQSCFENYFCCSGSQCTGPVDRNGQTTYVCQ